jgi:hypothetical protein
VGNRLRWCGRLAGFFLKEGELDWQVCVILMACVGVLDAALDVSDVPGFAPSGDSLFFEVRKEK